MSVSRVFLMFMSLCVGFASCVKDPDPSLHSAPEILNTTFSVEGLDVQLRCSKICNFNDIGHRISPLIFRPIIAYYTFFLQS